MEVWTEADCQAFVNDLAVEMLNRPMRDVFKAIVERVPMTSHGTVLVMLFAHPEADDLWG